MPRRAQHIAAPVQSAVLNYLRTAGWRGIGPVPHEWLIRYLYGQETRRNRVALQRIVQRLRAAGFPIRTVRGFGYEFVPRNQPARPCNARVTMSPAMPVMSPPAQHTISHHRDLTEAVVRS